MCQALYKVHLIIGKLKDETEYMELLTNLYSKTSFEQSLLCCTNITLRVKKQQYFWTKRYLTWRKTGSETIKSGVTMPLPSIPLWVNWGLRGRLQSIVKKEQRNKGTSKRNNKLMKQLFNQKKGGIKKFLMHINSSKSENLVKRK